MTDARKLPKKLSVTERAESVPAAEGSVAPNSRRPSLAHYVRFIGDVVSPIEIEWEAMKDD